jgi:hypothetical protein
MIRAMKPRLEGRVARVGEEKGDLNVCGMITPEWIVEK